MTATATRPRITPEIRAIITEITALLPTVKITGSLSLLAFDLLAPSRTIGDVDLCIAEWNESTLETLENAGFECVESESIFDDEDAFLCCAVKNGIKCDIFRSRRPCAEINSAELQGSYSYPIFAIRAKVDMLEYLEKLPNPTEKQQKAISKHSLDIAYFQTHSNNTVKI